MSSSEELKKDDGGVSVHLRFFNVEHEGVQYFLTRFASMPGILREQGQTARSILFSDEARHAWPVKVPGGGNDGKDLPAWRFHDPRSVTIFVRPMGGVAYTTGSILDDEHKEIHVSAEYIDKIVKRAATPATSALTTDKPTPTRTMSASSSMSTLLSRFRQQAVVQDHISGKPANIVELELRGVLVHEWVHTVQFNGKDTCPGGLIEGIADWVRMKAGLAAPHWQPPCKGDKKQGWDAGYSLTAYFLLWLETKLDRPHLVPHINQALASMQWDKGAAMDRAVGYKVDLKALWHEFCEKQEERPIAAKEGDKAKEVESDDDHTP